MSNHLEGKSVVVTGGGRGIGRAIALAAAEAGASVVIADYGGGVDRNKAGTSEAADAVVARSQPLAEEQSRPPSTCRPWRGAETLSRQQWIASAGSTAWSAAQGSPPSSTSGISEQEWDDVINVHIKGHFSCAKAAARLMIPQRSGSLIFLSSGALNGMPNTIAYSTAKAGILGFTWSTANRLGRFGIRTNCMVPSAATRMSDGIYGNAGKLTDADGRRHPQRLGHRHVPGPSNVAPFAVYFLSDLARDINGQVFRVQGYEVGRLHMLRYAPVMTNLGTWDVDILAERLPAELGPDLQPLPMPWPEPEGAKTSVRGLTSS